MSSDTEVVQVVDQPDVLPPDVPADSSALQYPAGQYPAPQPQRPRNTLVGTSFAVGAIFMYFGAIIGIYLSERADFLNDPENSTSGASWIPSGADLQLAAPSVVIWTLLFSVVTIQWAVYASNRNDRRHVLLALSVTALFGVAVINQFFFIINQMGLEIEGGSRAAPLIYTILGSYLAAMVVGLIFLLVAGLRVLGSESPKPNARLIASAAVYWDALVVIYFIVWIAIFITK